MSLLRRLPRRRWEGRRTNREARSHCKPRPLFLKLSGTVAVGSSLTAASSSRHRWWICSLVIYALSEFKGSKMKRTNIVNHLHSLWSRETYNASNLPEKTKTEFVTLQDIESVNVPGKTLEKNNRCNIYEGSFAHGVANVAFSPAILSGFLSCLTGEMAVLRWGVLFFSGFPVIIA